MTMLEMSHNRKRLELAWSLIMGETKLGKLGSPKLRLLGILEDENEGPPVFWTLYQLLCDPNNNVALHNFLKKIIIQELDMMALELLALKGKEAQDV